MGIINATAPTQVPLDQWAWDQNGKLVYHQDMNGSINGIVTEVDWNLADLYNYTNGVIGSGLQVSGSTGMTFTVSTGRGRALGGLKTVQLVTAGLPGQPSNFNITLDVGGVSDRTDTICLRYQVYQYTDSLGGENHNVDNTAIVALKGITTLPDNSYVSLAQILVPAGATTYSQCTINNSKRTNLGNLSTSVVNVPIGSSVDHNAASWTDDGHFMLEDGRVLTIASYPELYAVIGTTWGAGNNDGLSYNIPDSRSRYRQGADNFGTAQGAAGRLVDATGFTANAVAGNSGGAAPITLTSSQLASHTHTFTGSAHNHTGTDSGHAHTEHGAINSGGSSLVQYGNSLSGDATTGSTTSNGTANITIGSTTATGSNSSTGSGANIDNRPPFNTKLVIIRYR